jgi:hypothetical protein
VVVDNRSKGHRAARTAGVFDDFKPQSG